jgi:ATP-dependent Clp protease adapter protein ClpS
VSYPTITETPLINPIEEISTPSHGDRWIVTVYDNPFNTFDEVTFILMLATNCSVEEATTETWEVHHLGKSVVHHGDEATCRRVAGVIAKIGIQVEASPEP